MSEHAAGNAQPNVEFFFDPICPWCWMTSRWVAEVARLRGFEVAWRPISLQIINEGNDAGPYAEAQRQGHRMGRVAVAVAAAEQGSSAVGALYTELGNRIHPAGRSDYDTIIAEALAAAGLEPDGVDAGVDAGADAALASDLAAAADDEGLDGKLRENTDFALKAAGPDVGVPIISIDGQAFFGPVVTPAPMGDDALQLWDGIYAAISVPGFYELKRGRTVGPQF